MQTIKNNMPVNHIQRKIERSHIQYELKLMKAHVQLMETNVNTTKYIRDGLHEISETKESGYTQSEKNSDLAVKACLANSL